MKTGPAVAGDCWKRIGIWGDRSCPELRTQIHCRNCPVHSAGAARLLHAEVSDDYLAEHARHYATPKRAGQGGARSAVVFRLADEWFALPTAVFREVAPLRAIHSLPHRRERTVTGLTNVRGELIVCVSLGSVLGLAESPAAGPAVRLAVISHEGERYAFPAEEIAGLCRYDEAGLARVPATLAHARASYTRGLLAWQGRTVGVLDEGLLFYKLGRSLA